MGAKNLENILKHLPTRWKKEENNHFDFKERRPVVVSVSGTEGASGSFWSCGQREKGNGLSESRKRLSGGGGGLGSSFRGGGERRIG